MKQFTLDTNSIIDIEEERTDAKYLLELIDQWNQGKIELGIVAVSASENQKGGVASQNYGEFQGKLEATGLVNAHELQPIGIWDVTFWDHFLLPDEKMAQLAIDLREVLFPDATNLPPNEISKNSKWRNQMCDVLVAWSHAYHQWDYLVTRDKNFHKKGQRIGKLGVRNVVSPEEAVKSAT